MWYFVQAGGELSDGYFIYCSQDIEMFNSASPNSEFLYCSQDMSEFPLP
jgi:hypothetical protein